MTGWRYAAAIRSVVPWSVTRFYYLSKHQDVRAIVQVLNYKSAAERQTGKREKKGRQHNSSTHTSAQNCMLITVFFCIFHIIYRVCICIPAASAH